MASFDPESPFPRDPAGRFGPTSPGSLPVAELRSVRVLDTTLSPPGFRRSFSHREGLDNNMGAGCQQQHRPPLGVELTGYRLLTTGMILGLGIPKAVYSYSGQSLISATLDWVACIICALM